MTENSREIDVYALAQELQGDQQNQGKAVGRSPQDGTAQKLEQLTEKYDQLYCLSRAVWELLQEKTDLQEADLQQKLATIQAQQHFATKPKAELCPDCDRPLQRIEGKHYKCIYCGHTQDFKSVFDKLL